MSEPLQIKSLEAEIQSLEAMLKAERSAVQRNHRILFRFTALLGGIILFFVAINFYKVRAELTSEKLSRSIEQELAEVAPTAMKEFQLLGEDLLPIYVEQLKAQLQASWPQISAKVESELMHLSDNLQMRINALLAESETRILDKIGSTMAKSYPEIADPKKQEMLAAQLHATCDRALEKAILDFDKLFSKELTQVQDRLLKVDISDENVPTVELQKKFLHLWLQLLDQEIMKI